MTKNSQQRINNIIGQLEGIKKMLDGDQDCVKVLVQMKAVKAALNSVTSKLVEENMNNCIGALQGKNKEKMTTLIKEITKL